MKLSVVIYINKIQNNVTACLFFQFKMCGIKLLVKWLRGMEAIDNTSVPAYPVLNLLETLIRHQGDLQAKGLVR